MSPSNEQQKGNQARGWSATALSPRSGHCSFLRSCSTGQKPGAKQENVSSLWNHCVSSPNPCNQSTDKVLFRPTRDQEFVVRLTPNGRIIDCDERVKGILELLPQDMIGTSLYDHLHSNDIPRIVEVSPLCTAASRIRAKRISCVLEC